MKCHGQVVVSVKSWMGGLWEGGRELCNSIASCSWSSNMRNARLIFSVRSCALCWHYTLALMISHVLEASITTDAQNRPPGDPGNPQLAIPQVPKLITCPFEVTPSCQEIPFSFTVSTAGSGTIHLPPVKVFSWTKATSLPLLSAFQRVTNSTPSRIRKGKEKADNKE